MVDSKNKGVDLTGLGEFNVSSLISGNLKEEKHNVEKGVLSYAPIECFFEDINNARKKFDPTALEELVNSIKAISPVTGKPTGIKQPLSVKKHPEKEGYFIINGGNRRYRAGKLAELKELPYFISENNDDFDNVVDNLMRDGLKTEEIAYFITERIKSGDRKGDIAKRLGKSAPYVSHYAVFNELHDSIRDLLDNGLCDSMQGLGLLHRAHNKYGAVIISFCENVSMPLSVNSIREFIHNLNAIKTETKEDKLSPLETEEINDIEKEAFNESEDKSQLEKEVDDDDNKSKGRANDNERETKIKDKSSLVFLIEFDGSQGKLVLKNTPEYGQVFIKLDNGETKKVDASLIKLISVEID